ncbi:MAG: orotidine-5'-phosphate decarboxylase [Capsulimonadaceae bacterium]|nr:orotidine-5'-phosphate decarboxylase [Capsulimonadaceae bacterium]
MSTVNPIIVAVDVPAIEPAIGLVRSLAPHVGAFKVGLELFNAVGARIFDALREAAGGGVNIFYDAKFHDIPNTVAGAVRAAVRHNIWMTNIHASGGSAMMKAAVEAAQTASGQRPLVIAVTVLTSIDDATLSGELGVNRTAAEQVVALARLAQDSGCDGVVASPRETSAIREACGPEFVIVTPGVRPVGAALGDQKRVMTPAEAIAQGASYLVIGRPITGAPDPAQAAIAIGREIGIG